MSFGQSIIMDLPNHPVVDVKSTSNRGMTPEEISELCVNKIVNVSSTAHPVIREQAEAFKKDIEVVILHYIKQAVVSDRTTIYNKLNEAGQPQLADAVRRL